MDFSSIKKWMLKMNNILEMYSTEESFTQSEKNLLLDYNNKIRDAIQTITVEDDSELSEINNNKPDIKAKTKKSEEPSLSLKPQASFNHSSPYQDLFLFKKVEDLSEKLESTPIKNILTAMGLNEKILTQNELFNGDKNSFELTIQKLNSLANFEEAQSYLCEEIIPKYEWTDEKRIKKAQWLIKLIKRKYSE